MTRPRGATTRQLSVRAHRVYQIRLVRVRSCKTGQGKLMRSAIHLGTERNRAAILFADLSGSTALVESSRPETVYRRIRPIMDELVSVVTEHGGDIQQVLADGFMAVFGALHSGLAPLQRICRRPRPRPRT
jgi:class 3 adenylate cyclase